MRISDWSSDVCSSDLLSPSPANRARRHDHEMTGDPAMTSFTALRVHAPEKNRTEARFDQLSVDDLSTGEVVVRIAWTGINYKDALAVTDRKSTRLNSSP